jgi:hypothetical protein
MEQKRGTGVRECVADKQDDMEATADGKEGNEVAQRTRRCSIEVIAMR